MNIRNIKNKEYNKSLTNKYFYAKMDKKTEFTGETVEDFLARGGQIRKIKKESIVLGRDEKGRYLKKEAQA